MPDSTPYGAAFYEEQKGISLSSARRVVPELLSLLPVASVVDVGCGVGTWLSVFRALGVEDFLGIDGSYVDRAALLIPPERFLARDLTQDFAVGRRFDLALSLEVAEHLPVEAAERFVAQLCGLSDLVVFSAALPRQGGTFHVNEQWPSYWRAHFERQGMSCIDGLRSRFWDDPRVDLCYRNNLLIFARPEARARHPALEALGQGSAATMLDVVHPERYFMLLQRNRPESLSAAMLLALLPAALLRAARRRLRV